MDYFFICRFPISFVLKNKNDMMKKLLFTLLLGCSLLSIHAHETDTVRTDFLSYSILEEVERTGQLEPSFLPCVVSVSDWKSNWFANLSGGVSSFLGSPLGCNDLFGRMKPLLQFSVGKWHTPAVGNRIVYSGNIFKDAMGDNRKYGNFHADLMVNLNGLSNHFLSDIKWCVIPFAGVGFIRNYHDGQQPFAFSYGILGQYRLTDRLNLTMELDGTTTFKNFDGYGDSRKLGDNLLNLSAGLSFTIGKTGWKRVIDAAPYMAQNDWMLKRMYVLGDRYNRLLKEYNASMETVIELKKILDYDGLLDKYKDRLSVHAKGGLKTGMDNYPKNDYSGLNQLRKRLADGNSKLSSSMNNTPLLTSKDKGISGNTSDINDKVSRYAGRSGTNNSSYESSDTNNDLTDFVAKYDKVLSGAPVHFFFRLGTTDFTDPSQIINIDEIARIAKKHNLSLTVMGSADAATGNARLNKHLAENRAKYISTLLIERGVEESNLKLISHGGISRYSPKEANRQTVVFMTINDL